MSTNPGFGKPKYGAGGNYAKNVRLKEGTATVVRILPPMKSLAETGEWAVYLGTHFGYKGVNAKDRSKPLYRPFKCIEERDFKTKMTLQDCPECDLIKQRKAELEATEADAKAKGHNAGEIEEITKVLKDWVKEHNVDRKWHMNVKMQDGSFAVLQISHKTKKLLEAEIARVLSEDSIEALELDQGVWFRFSRSGKGIDTQDTVTVEYESVRDASSGRVVRTVKLAPITEAEAEKALKECPDLAKNVREITYEQVSLLSQCSGDDEDVDAIFAMGEKREASPAPRVTTAPAVTRPAPVKAESAPVAAPAESAPAPAAEDDEEAAALAALAAIKAKKAAAAVAAQAKAETPTSQAPVAPTPAAAPAAGLPVDRTAFMQRFAKPKTA